MHRVVPVHFAGGRRPCRVDVTDLYDLSVAVAAGLRRRGIGPGSAVAVQLPNWPEGAAASLGTFLAGATLVPIVHSFGPAEVGFILRQSRARALFVPDRWRHIDYMADLRHVHIPSLEVVGVVGDEAPSGTVAFEDLLGVTAGFEPPRVSPDDVCALVYTSGTTAEPKGVQHSHRTLLAEVDSLPALLGTGADAVHLQVFPAGHIAGALGLLRPVAHGTPTILMDAWDADLAARLVDEYRVTASSGTPYFLSTLLDAAEAHGGDLSSLREFMTGAAAVPPALVERAEGAGIKTFRAYGSTEHPTVTSGRAGDPLWERAYTDGRCAPGNEVRILDASLRDVPAGHDGEVAVRGPERFVGYRDSRLDAAAFLPGGWFRTGDVGRLHDSGCLTITDRLKDIIIRGGENIASKQVEDVLATLPAVAEAAVVAAPDERMGERVCAFVVLRPGASLDLEEVRAHFASAGLARHKSPEQLEIVDDLPRTASGKVRKFDLREALRRGQLPR